MTDDPLLAEARAAIKLSGRARAVLLQKALGIGYERAVRILDAMTAAGDLGPDTPTGAREVRFK